MHASGFLKFGSPDVLRQLELPVPQPSGREVLVRVAASTVNPTDLLMRSGGQSALMVGLVPPYIAGMEFSGHVHAVGQGVTSVTVGQPVMGVVNPRRKEGGAHAEFIAVPSVSLVPLDPEVDLVSAATVPMNGLTALMVIEALALPPGSSVLVTGGVGAVGGYVIPLARKAGLVVIADGKNEDVALLKSLGASVVLPRGDALAGEVCELYPQGVDGLVDTALISDQVSRAVRDAGVAVSLRKANPITDPRLQARYVGVLDRANDTAALEHLSRLLKERVITPRVAHRMPMSEARAAHTLVEQGGLRGRVVLIF